MELLCTAEAYKGQGAGSLILQHGCELADKDKLECYIDSSPRGKRVYEKFGFVFTKHVLLPMHYNYHFGVRRPQTDADESFLHRPNICKLKAGKERFCAKKRLSSAWNRS